MINLPRHQYRKQLARATGAPFGVGAYRPGSVLLVGEQASNTDEDPNQEPFCGVRGCSVWLNKLLDSAEVPEERLFWVNAKNNDGTWVDFDAVLSAVQPPHVVTLGNVAKSLVKLSTTDRRFVWWAVPHPQYWKRFKSKQEYELIRILKNIFQLSDVLV